MEFADILNRDVLGEIFDFVPPQIKRKLNKTFHQKYPANILRMDSFMRTIIRKDYAFIFELHLKYNYKRWRKLTRWIHKNLKFHNYIEYLRYLCHTYKSNSCKNKLIAFEKIKNPNKKKKYKKMKIRNIRWSN